MLPESELIAERVTRKDLNHDGFEKHQQEFANPALGPPQEINSREDFGRHVAEVLESSSTRCFTAYSTKETYNQADVYYHPPSNTAVIVPEDASQAATAFRPERRERWFDLKLAEVERREQLEIEITHGGIRELKGQTHEGDRVSLANQHEVRGQDGISGSAVKALDVSAPELKDEPASCPPPRFLDRDVLDSINELQAQSHGGEQGVRDGKAADEVLEKAQATYYENPNSDIYDVAGEYVSGLASRQPYANMNENTAAQAAIVFMEANGVDTSRIPENTIHQTVRAAANHEADPQQVASEFREAIDRSKTTEKSQGGEQTVAALDRDQESGEKQYPDPEL